jgi:hypothetical protein
MTIRVKTCSTVKMSPDEKMVRNCEIVLVCIKKNNGEGMQVKTENIE